MLELSQELPSPASTSLVQREAAAPLVEDASPFGLQGLRRETLQILKPECVTRLAITLALLGTPEEIRNREYVDQLLSRRADWLEEFTVVHLIEKSLWIAGHSDLVMTLTKNPSQIPDRPPAAITKALTASYALHPQGTIWYGVPVFGDEVNRQGLPIPLTAKQVQDEHERRVTAAQQHAASYRNVYRAIGQLMMVPGRAVGAAYFFGRAMKLATVQCVETVKQARRDAWKREAARSLAQLQHYRTGRSWVEVPKHSTWLGSVTEGGLSFAKVASRCLAAPAAFAGISGVSMAMASAAPSLVVPLTIVSCDPFLFVELPDEPGQLRFLGHWYWQGSLYGKQKLHLHAT